MPERSEMQKLLKLPTKVKLGEGEFEIKPLPLLYSLPWRERVADLYITFIKESKVDTDTPDSFINAMKNVMVISPNKIIDLFFEYARNLKREEILAVADSDQLLTAWAQIVEFEKPFLAILAATVTLIAKQ